MRDKYALQSPVMEILSRYNRWAGCGGIPHDPVVPAGSSKIARDPCLSHRTAGNITKRGSKGLSFGGIGKMHAIKARTTIAE